MTNWHETEPEEMNEPPALPPQYGIDTSYYEDKDTCELIGSLIRRLLHFLTSKGFDLRSLDGITVAQDCLTAAVAIQNLPDFRTPPKDATDPANTLELARTFAVWRESELRFHVVLEETIGRMLLAEEEPIKAFAIACIAHEAAHVHHEGHFYRMFPHLYGRPLECGDRDRQRFMKAIDVWSEYAACRTSARFRPQAIVEHEMLLSRAIRRFQRGDSECTREATDELFLCAGYCFGQMKGLDMDLNEHLPSLRDVLQDNSKLASVLGRLRDHLDTLWTNQEHWTSIEVFAGIYDLSGETE